MAILLTQWLCAHRHCSIAIPWDDQFDSREVVTERGEAMYSQGLLNRWCGICGGHIEPEHAPTLYKSVEALIGSIVGVVFLSQVGPDHPVDGPPGEQR